MTFSGNSAGSSSLMPFQVSFFVLALPFVFSARAAAALLPAFVAMRLFPCRLGVEEANGPPTRMGSEGREVDLGASCEARRVAQEVPGRPTLGWRERFDRDGQFARLGLFEGG